jgi:hypothetical protein
MSSTARTWTPRHRLAAGLVLLVSASGVGALLPAQAPPDGPKIVFSPSAGTFVARQVVTLTADATAGIHYTLDGSLPSADSPVYRGPLTLDQSTRLRAVAIPSGPLARAGPVATEIYLRVDPDTETFTSHLPIVLIHTFESGPLDAYGTEHVPAAVQVLAQASGTTRLVGRAALDSRIGIHVRGQSTRRFPKKQYAVELRADDRDADHERPLLGMPSGAEWVLSDSVFYDRSLIRNALAFALSNRIGRYAPRTRFAEVFMVDDGGDVRAGSFLGFYTLIEKIARGPERVHVSPLPESAKSPPAVSGGFILRIDKGAADFYAGGRRLQFVYPDSDDMMLPGRKPQADFIRAYVDDLARAACAADLRHPATGQSYSAFIDVDAWIDHHIINALAKNVDGLRFSAYFHKERDGRLVAGPVWDFDRSFGTPYDPRSPEPEEWKTAWSDATDYFADGWWGCLFRDPAFRSRYRDRFTALLNGEFSADNLDRIVDATAAGVGDAAARNFRRWTQMPPLENSHAAEIALMKDFLRRRVAWIKSQLASGF